MCEGGGVGRSKKHKETENSDLGVQSFGHNSKTNQDIENQKSSLTSPINSEAKGIKIILKLFELHLHRLASLSHIINFSDVNLHNSQTFKLINLYLESFLFGTITNHIFS